MALAVTVIPPAELREEVEEYMKDFDEGEQLEKIQREKRTREPDEEGFVVVKQRYVLRTYQECSNLISHPHDLFSPDVCVI